MHTSTHGLSSLLPGFSTPLLIQRKFNELVMVTRYFYTVLKPGQARPDGSTQDPANPRLESGQVEEKI